jgi:Tfp pilus assembly protein PilN
MMTRINLLPNSRRKRQISSLSGILPALGIAAVVLVSAGAWGWVHFVVLAGAETAHQDTQRQHQSLQADLNYQQSLLSERGDYMAREETIQEIRALGVPWTRKLDELWDVTVIDPEGDRYLVSYDEVKVKTPRFSGKRRKGPSEGETVTLKGVCYTRANALQSFTFFHEALTSSPFFEGDFLSITNPEGSLVRSDDELEPKIGWTIDLELMMKPREPKKKSAKPRGRVAEKNR